MSAGGAPPPRLSRNPESPRAPAPPPSGRRRRARGGRRSRARGARSAAARPKFRAAGRGPSGGAARHLVVNEQHTPIPIGLESPGPLGAGFPPKRPNPSENPPKTLRKPSRKGSGRVFGGFRKGFGCFGRKPIPSEPWTSNSHCHRGLGCPQRCRGRARSGTSWPSWASSRRSPRKWGASQRRTARPTLAPRLHSPRDRGGGGRRGSRFEDRGS